MVGGRRNDRETPGQLSLQGGQSRHPQLKAGSDQLPHVGSCLAPTAARPGPGPDQTLSLTLQRLGSEGAHGRW